MKSTQKFIDERQHAHNKCAEVQKLDETIDKFRDSMAHTSDLLGCYGMLSEKRRKKVKHCIDSAMVEELDELIEMREKL